MSLFKDFINRKTVSLVIATLVCLSTLLPLTKESLPASLAGNLALLNTTVQYSGIDYPADTPTTGVLVPNGSAINYYIDFSNDSGSTDAITNFTLSTTNHSAWSGSATCSFMSGAMGQDHTTLDFDTLGSPCSFDVSYVISGLGFPTSLAVGNAVYIRITGLSVNNTSIGFTAKASGLFANNDPIAGQRNAAYVRVGALAIVGQVFNDSNMDSIHAPGELGISGVSITLHQENPGNNVDPIVNNTEVTDENGYYMFDEFDYPGFSPFSSYRISAIVGYSYRLTTGNNVQQFFTVTSSLYTAEDIGFRIPISSNVGDRVWIDYDGDGIQDAGIEESGVGGIHFELMNADTDLSLADTYSGVGGAYALGHQDLSQCFGQNINQAGGSVGNAEVSYSCEVQPGGQYFLTFRTDNFCQVDHSAFRLLDADNNILAEGSCNRSGYPNNLVAETVYHYGPFTETQAGFAHLNVIDDYGDITFYDVNWNYSGPIGYHAYLTATDIPVEYTLSPADQGSDIFDSDMTSEVTPGVYRTDNFFFQYDYFNQGIDMGLIGAPPADVADVSVQKTVDAPSTGSGDVVTYHIVVTNLSSTVTANSATVQDILPSQVSYVGQSATIGIYDSNTGEWPIGDLAPSSSAELEIQASINDIHSPTITNTASVTINGSESDISNNSDSVDINPTAPIADVSVTKVANAPTPTLGSTVTYTITATNNSATDTAYEMTVTDILPPQLTFVSQTATSGNYDPMTGIWLVGNVAHNNEHTLIIVATINTTSSTISNTATITTSSQDLVPGNNSSTADVIPTPEPSPSPSPTPSESPSPSPSPSPTPSDSPSPSPSPTPSESPSPSPSPTPSDSPSPSPSPTPSESPSPSPSPSPSSTPTPTPSPTPTSSSSGSNGSSGGSGGGIINPGGIVIVNGGNNNNGNSGWRYSNSTNSNRRSTSKQSQTATIIPAVPPAPTADPIACLVAAGTPSINFLDIQVANYQTQAHFLTSILNKASNTRIIQGYGDQNYGMGKILTRFELTKIALQANCLQPNQLTPNHIFSDVPQDNSEMSLIIGTAQSLGIVQGKDGKFYPNQAVTYAEMSKILLGSGYYFQDQTPDIIYSTSFPGITDESFRQYAEYAVRLGLVTLNNGSFPQNAPIYRDSMLQVLSRYISYLKNISVG